MSNFLTPEEIHKLTGWKQARKQCQQLDMQQIDYYIDCKGRPQVAVSAIHKKIEPYKIPTKLAPKFESLST